MDGEDANVMMLVVVKVVVVMVIIMVIMVVMMTSEKAMAPHSSVLAWRIPGMVEPGWLPSMGSHRVGHD